MDRNVCGFWKVITATLLTLAISQCPAVASQQGFQKSTGPDSFEDRMELYKDWTQNVQRRKLSDAYAPTISPTVPIISPSTSPTAGITPSANIPISSVIQPPPGTPGGPGGPGGPPAISPASAVTPAAAAPSPISGFPLASSGYGGCKVLRYATGYANTTLYYNNIVYNSPNFGECCKSCQRDPLCVAWTRVAGGDGPNFRNCYLKYDLLALDQSLQKNINNHEGHPGDAAKYPELRYVNVDYPSAATPLILESGTIPDVYPADYYGCPYQPNAVSPCNAPPTCNVDGNGVFVPPACI